MASSLFLPVDLATATGTGALVLQSSPALITPDIGAATGATLALTGKIITYDNIATAGEGVLVQRKATHLAAQTAAIPSIATFTPATDNTIDVMLSLLVTVSSGENFTATVSYTDTGNTARVATLPFRLLTGANTLIVNFANGTVPYFGVLQQFRAKAGTTMTLATVGTFTGCTYSLSANIFESQ